MRRRSAFANSFDYFLREERRKKKAIAERERMDALFNKNKNAVVEKIAQDKNLDPAFAEILKDL